MSTPNPTALLDDIIARLGALPESERKEVERLADEATRHMKWVPNPGPQTEAYFSEADELFYGGAGGGGKTALLCGVSVNEHYDIQLFRRESTQLRGLVKELTEIIGSTDGFNAQLGVWKLGAGQTIELAGVKDETDKEKWQGRAADLKGFDEITHFSPSQFRFIIGWNRSTRPGQRCRVIATGNPPVTADGLWVIKYWAPWLDDQFPDPEQPGKLRWPVRRTDDSDDDDDIFFRSKEEALDHLSRMRRPPRDHKGSIIPPRSRTFIPARLEDNPDLMRTGYAAVLDAMPKELREAMRDGKFKSTFRDDDFQVIPTAWIDAAMRRWTPEVPSLMTHMGVDVAQGGNDKTVLAPRHDNWCAELVVRKGIDTKDGPAVAGLVIASLKDRASVNIDLGGGWGGSAYDHLSAASGLDVVGIVPSAGSTARTKDGRLSFLNMRAETWWNMRELLDPSQEIQIALPMDNELRADLAAPRWELKPGGRIKIEMKEEIRARLGRSPDKGDAVVLAFATGRKARDQSWRGMVAPAVITSGPLMRRG